MGLPPGGWLRSALSRRCEGQAIVEFAIVAPLLLLLILGVVDFARAWNAQQVITDAAREGARNAALDNPAETEGGIRALVGSALGRAGFDPDEAAITIEGVGAGRGVPVTVNITYPYEFILIRPFVHLVTGDGSITLATSIVMRHE